MNNYQKYAGTLERFADFVAELNAEEGTGESLTRCFCRSQCVKSQGDVNCTDENLKQCIVAWLEEKTEESKESENVKIFRTRERMENHIQITVEGGESRKNVREILAALRKLRHRKKISYCITVVDFRQEHPQGHNQLIQAD